MYKLITGIIIAEASIFSALAGWPNWAIMTGMTVGAVLICWWVVSSEMQGTGSQYPYPSEIYAMIENLDVPLIELVLAIEGWVEHQPPDSDWEHRYWARHGDEPLDWWNERT